MREEGAQSWRALANRLAPMLEQLIRAPAHPRRDHPRVPQHPGVYLFSEGRRPLYVGQTRNLNSRLAHHTRPTGRHNSATFAFLLAVEAFGRSAQGLPKRTREQLENDPRFAATFLDMKHRVADMEVQWVESDDPELRTVFEVYAALMLGTPHNSFETH